jgi:uncharacterized protein
MDENATNEKMGALFRRLEDLGSLLVAFSGGVDSTFLLAAAHRVLGDRVMAVTARGDLFPAWEREEALAFVRKEGIAHLVLDADPMALPEVAANTPERCYHCKRHLFLEFRRIAEENALEHTAHGANTDDLRDYRPGHRAAAESGILAPLVEARLDKDDVRRFARSMGLRVWDKPSMACLATRVPYGDPLTPDKLRMIESAEAVLSARGIRTCRVRLHGVVARIEAHPLEIAELAKAEIRKDLIREFRKIGFPFVALDLEGYRSGSLNRLLEEGEDPCVTTSI